MLELRSFDIYKNATAPTIAMLDHSEVDMEISSAGIETTESNNCREVSEDDSSANRVLAIMQERTKIFHKDGQNFINPFT